MPTAALVVLLVVLAHGCACATPPPDEALLRRFEAHKPQLEELLEEVLSNPRMQEIERVLGGFSGRVGVRSVDSWPRVADWPVEFVIYDYVLYHDGIRKGIAWCECTPDPVLPSLNGRKRHEGEAFRHITGNWYLFFSPT